MAGIGLSRPMYAIYTESSGTVTYSGFAALGKAVELTMDLTDGSDNILYADNGPAEVDNAFSGGTLAITVDDLRPEAAAAVLGLTLQAVTNAGIVDTTTPKELVFGDGQVIPYCGFGAILKKKVGGATKWQAIVWTKVQFSTPGLSATTQGDSIEWQTAEMNAILMRDDTADHNWVRMSVLDSEADALAYIGGILNPPSPVTT